MKVSKELQNTVKANPLIQEVYFDEDGNHFFRKHKATIYTDNGHGLSEKAGKEVDCLGTKDGILKIKQPNGVVIDKKVHTSYIAIKETMSREDLLNAVPVLKELSDKEENDILAKAAEIYRKRGVASYESTDANQNNNQNNSQNYNKNKR